MRKRFVVVCALILSVVILTISLAGCNGGYKKIPKNGKKIDLNDGTWTQTFADEFDGNKLDDTVWSINKAVRRAAYYKASEDTVFVKDGNLTIRTKYETTPLGDAWTSSFISTNNYAGEKDWVQGDNFKGFKQKYGYFEVRCIAPPSVGIWSAFWMMPSEGAPGMSANDVLNTGTDGVEIDIMESPYMYNEKYQELNTHVVHGDGYKPENLKSHKSDTYIVPNMYTEFHTYGIEWNETEYIFYIDGIETWRTKHTVEGADGKKFNMGTSQVEEYLLLTVEVAGEYDNKKFYPGRVKNKAGEWEDFWCGNPMKNDTNKAYDFVIDYVRAYSKVA